MQKGLTHETQLDNSYEVTGPNSNYTTLYRPLTNRISNHFWVVPHAFGSILYIIAFRILQPISFWF